MPSLARTVLDATLMSAREARTFVSSVLSQWRCEHLDEVAVLLTSEIVSNAVIHARSRLALEVCLDAEVLRVEVRDGDRRLPMQRAPDADSIGGRGLLLVDELSSRWGAAADDDGKVVWFELQTGSTRWPPSGRPSPIPW